MIKPNYYIVCYKAKATDTTGYLFLQSKGRKNRTKKALGIAVNYGKFKDNWNEREQKFKSGMENYKILNEKINKAVEDFTKEDGTEIIETNTKGKQSFLKYWDKEIGLIPKQGSKVKHQTVKKKLEKYLKSINKNDINFSDLTPDFINSLHYHFKIAPELTTSSVNSYMKLINNIIRRKTKDDPYTFAINPFVSIKYEKKQSPNRKVLNEKEIDSLLSTRIIDADLDFVRDMYAFQIFASGMRISDLCLLRWKNLVPDIVDWKQYSDDYFKIKHNNTEPRLEYSMYKTGAEVEIPLTFYACKAILRALDNMSPYYECMNYNNLLGKNNGVLMDYKRDIEPELKNNTYKANEPDTINYKGYFIKRNNESIKGIIDCFLPSSNRFYNGDIYPYEDPIALYNAAIKLGKNDTAIPKDFHLYYVSFMSGQQQPTIDYLDSITLYQKLALISGFSIKGSQNVINEMGFNEIIDKSGLNNEYYVWDKSEDKQFSVPVGDKLTITGKFDETGDLTNCKISNKESIFNLGTMKKINFKTGKFL